MNTENPLVTIIVRTKDRPKLLRRALQSIGAQTYRPIEVVLVNDGGCDLNIGELKTILGDVSLNYVRLEKNTGRAHAGNVGIRNAQGKYVGFLDDDDIFYSEHISVLVSVFEKYDCKVSYTDANIALVHYDPESWEIVTHEKRVFTSRDFSFAELLIDNYIPLICLLFSRDIFSVIQGFDEIFELYEDWDLLIRIAEHYPFHYVGKVTAEYVQWSDTLQISQTPRFTHKADEMHKRIIGKHWGKFTPDMLQSLVQNRRELREKKRVLSTLEMRLQEWEGRVADLECIRTHLERMLREQEIKLQDQAAKLLDQERRAANLERTLHERESALERIYSSRGWKFLLFYYGLRDRLLPHNSKRRTFVKAAVKAAGNPLKVVQNLSVMNMRKFFHYLKNADPSVLEHKMNKKLSGTPGAHTDAPVLSYGAGAVKMPLEKNSILFMGSFSSMSQVNNTLSDKMKQVMKYLKELNYDVTVLDNSNTVQEYLKTYGGKFSFVVGSGPEYCFRCFPFVRAYSPRSKLFYYAGDLEDEFFTIELLNASVSDGVIADNEDKKQRLLQRKSELPIEVLPDAPDMKSSVKRLFSNSGRRERSEEDGRKGTISVEDTPNKSDHGKGDVHEGVQSTETRPVLVVGIYLAGQENTVDHLVEQIARSKRYRVTQKWIALGGDAASEHVKAVTTMKIETPIAKFQLLNVVLAGEDLYAYDYVLISDDDIRLPDNFLDEYLFLQEKFDFALAQPARTHNSYIDHPFVEQLDGLTARRTRFVEIGPVFSIRKDAFSILLPFDESSSMGWGYDYVWPCLIEDKGLRMGIIDATPVEHSIRKPMHNYRYEDEKNKMQTYLSKKRHLSAEEAFRILESYTL